MLSVEKVSLIPKSAKWSKKTISAPSKKAKKSEKKYRMSEGGRVKVK